METTGIALQDAVNRRIAQIVDQLTSLHRERELLIDARRALAVGEAPAVVMAKLTTKGVKVGGFEDAIAEAAL